MITPKKMRPETSTNQLPNVTCVRGPYPFIRYQHLTLLLLSLQEIMKHVPFVLSLDRNLTRVHQLASRVTLPQSILGKTVLTENHILLGPYRRTGRRETLTIVTDVEPERRNLQGH